MPTSGSGSASSAVSSGYPTSTDLATYLANSGFTLTAGQTTACTTAIAAAIADFEGFSGRRFLAVSGVRVFDPPTNPRAYLPFNEDLAGLDGGGVTLLDTALVLNTDFWLINPNSSAQVAPFQALRLKSTRVAPLTWPNYNSLVITGNWGYGSVPADVFQAMLARAAWVMAPSLIFNFKLGGLESWTEANVSEKYGENPLAALMEAWGGKDGMGGLFGAMVKRYQRWRVS